MAKDRWQGTTDEWAARALVAGGHARPVPRAEAILHSMTTVPAQPARRARPKFPRITVAQIEAALAKSRENTNRGGS
jgi:hypothetical protein